MSCTPSLGDLQRPLSAVRRAGRDGPRQLVAPGSGHRQGLYQTNTRGDSWASHQRRAHLGDDRHPGRRPFTVEHDLRRLFERDRLGHDQWRLELDGGRRGPAAVVVLLLDGSHCSQSRRIARRPTWCAGAVPCWPLVHDDQRRRDRIDISGNLPDIPCLVAGPRFPQPYALPGHYGRRRLPLDQRRSELGALRLPLLNARVDQLELTTSLDVLAAAHTRPGGMGGPPGQHAPQHNSVGDGDDGRLSLQHHRDWW